ncbi:hypothetical protein [Sphingobacterium sp.]|uniref:hypothetical protein n=1 Tax=Sphingobacterium sp. TaxID=341027 RepID=UPI0028A6FC7E|nr:hypothetical protein [Sphingobacterium sp.]
MNLFCRSLRFLLAFLIPTLLCFSCKRKDHEAPQPDNGLHQVSFNFSNFQSEIQSYHSAPSTKSAQNDTLLNLHPDQFELLGNFDMNKKSLEPTYEYDKVFKMYVFTSLDSTKHFVNNPSKPADKDNYVFTLKALAWIEIKINLTKIHELDRIEFDLLSTDENQKYFYIQFLDQKDDSIVGSSRLIDIVPHSNASKQLQTYNIQIPKELKGNDKATIKILMKDPVNHTPYVEELVKHAHYIDNIKFYGRAKERSKPNLSDLPYFIFKKKTGELVKNGSFDLSQNNKEQLVELPYGSYYNLILFHDSPKKLLMPADIKNKDQIFIGHSFDDKFARSFAAIDSFDLKENVEKQVKLKRLYSLVTLNFSDIRDLKEIKKVTVRPITAPYFWKPFNIKVDTKILEEPTKPMEFEQDFNLNREISFSHFLGLSDKELPVQYEIEVWDKSKVIRKFRLKSNIKNNVKLIFKGPLYPSGFSTGFFEVIIDETWDANKVVVFK